MVPLGWDTQLVIGLSVYIFSRVLAYYTYNLPLPAITLIIIEDRLE